MTHSFVIPAEARHLGLALTEPERDSRGEVASFTARLTGPSLDASVRMRVAKAHTLAELFAEMANARQGWTGLKEWKSPEGELRLACTSDGKGEVRVAISLRPSLFQDDWQVHGTARIERTRLDSLAAAASLFLDEDGVRG